MFRSLCCSSRPRSGTTRGPGGGTATLGRRIPSHKLPGQQSHETVFADMRRVVQRHETAVPLLAAIHGFLPSD